ncbi:Protein CBG26246 [Caenorhabditis briggsae]|uniref:Protein CBG26246 n=1 Tax=Caenorhabditis briggsae TaxID=6238 RepID=B6ILW7_CAEBR|nr:Protein CBG26246 [Caenorhabditis briggsae]CAS00897.1 Protein CBG26246 [Caenorhabditis briggsae]
MLSLSPEDVNEAQSDLMDDRKQAYTIFVANSLKLEGIKTELEDIGEFDKDPKCPNFEFPLEFTREEKDGRIFVTNISSK